MRTLIEAAFMSLDGVVDAPGIVEEAGRHWQSDAEYEAYQHGLLFAADALLLGRKTYEVFAEAYPRMAAAQSGAPNGFVERMNSVPKWVASRSRPAVRWNATILSGDLPEAVARLKGEPGGPILKYGTGTLDHSLIEHGLIDELHIFLFPFVLGRGLRLFEEIPASRHFKLIASRSFKTGTVVLTYRCR